MATEVERIENLEGKYSDLHTVVNVLAAKVDATNNKVDNLISEMRDRDNRRADEIAEIRQSIKEIYQTTDNKISEIRNLSYISLTAIAAMVITVLFNLPKG